MTTFKSHIFNFYWEASLLLFDPEDGGNKFFRNTATAGGHIQEDKSRENLKSQNLAPVGKSL